jgi:FkbM family methyltransferase
LTGSLKVWEDARAMKLPTAQTLAGRLIRTPLKLIPKDAVIPVLQGPMRGAKWIAGSHTHGCWFGNYEYEKQKLFASLVHPGSIVYDVGANVGFYSLLAAKRGARVIACEPDPANVKLLARHIEVNRANVVIEQVAVCEREGTESFSCDGPEGSLGKGDMQVRTIRLDSLLDRYPVPTVIKIDVEGAEWRVLEGAQKILKHHPTVFLAFDDPIRTKVRGIELLTSFGYKYREVLGPNELLFA